jgi:hypothetical protein
VTRIPPLCDTQPAPNSACGVSVNGVPRRISSCEECGTNGMNVMNSVNLLLILMPLGLCSGMIVAAVAGHRLAVARRQAEAAADKEAIATLDQISTHLDDVKKCCRDLAECCEMDAIDGKRSAACCKALEASLTKAIAAHDKLVPPPDAGHGAMPAMPHHP